MKEFVIIVFLLLLPFQADLHTEVPLDSGVLSAPYGESKEAPCKGCAAKEKPIVASPSHLSVPYELSGRGRAALKFRRGSCTNPQNGTAGDCEATACKLEGKLSIKNNSMPGSTGRAVNVRVRGTSNPSSKEIQPGESTTVTFGDPASNTPEHIECGKHISLEISSYARDPNTNREVSVVRIFSWVCTSCGRGDQGNNDPTEDKSGRSPASHQPE